MAVTSAVTLHSILSPLIHQLSRKCNFSMNWMVPALKTHLLTRLKCSNFLKPLKSFRLFYRTCQIFAIAFSESKNNLYVSYRMIVSSPLITWVVVLGDFGRSPRMQYHTESLSTKPNSIVYVIGYGGASPLKSLVEARNVHIKTLPEVPKIITKLPGISFSS
jgi:hypothetical protein